MKVANFKSAPKIHIPLRYFFFGLLSLETFGWLLAFNSGEILTQHHYTQHTVALTHLLVLGWLSSTMIGALMQLTPVALGARLYSHRLACWTFWFLVVGVVGMVTSFWIWNFRFLMWFGTSMTIAFSLFAYNLFRTLKTVVERDIVFYFVVTSIICLILTFFAGEYLMHDKVIQFSPFHVLSAIHAHAHLAVIGWFLLMIMGMSYRLLPMFLLTEIQNPLRAWASYYVVVGSLPFLFIGILTQAAWIPFAACALSFGVVIWMWELIVIIQSRRRPIMGNTLRFALCGLLHVPLVIAIGIWLSFDSKTFQLFNSQLQTGYALIALLGFMTTFTVAMLYKVIPFLVWYQIYPPLVGLEKVPELKDLYSAKWEVAGMTCMILGSTSVAVATSFAYQIPVYIVQSSAVVLAIGFSVNAMNLYRVMAHWVLYVMRKHVRTDDSLTPEIQRQFV